MRSSSEALADRDGIRYRGPSSISVDVLFDARRVWSFDPQGHAPDSSGVRLVPWPDLIRSRLDGVASLTLRDHASGAVIDTAEVSFGRSTDRIRFVTEQGTPLVLTKWGRLSGMSFEGATADEVNSYLDQAAEVMRFVTEEHGLPAFVSYGTLLGAVRSGHLIGHDVDIDLGYLSSETNPLAVTRESFGLERALRRQGYALRRENGGFLALFLKQGNGQVRNLDLFTTFVDEGTGMLYQMHDTGLPGDRSTILPLRQVELEGQLFPAPRRAEEMLASAYGDDWRTPNPAFSYAARRRANPAYRRQMGWFGGLRLDRDLWSSYYSEHPAGGGGTPSSFARWVSRRLAGGCVIDVGSGTGTDTLYLAEAGEKAVGLEVVPRLVKRANARARRRGSTAEFRPLNLQSLRETLGTGALLAREPAPRAVYARRLLEGMSPVARGNFWRLCRMVLRGGGRCYLEVRTPRPGTPATVSGPVNHRTIGLEEVLAEARSFTAQEISRSGPHPDDSGDGEAQFHRLVLTWP